MDFATARQNMVESQLRTNRVTEDALLAAMRDVPREEFLPKSKRHLAYIDEDVALGGDRYLTEPLVLGRLIQSCEIAKSDSALIIGAGTGYAAALVGRLAGAVIAIDGDPQKVAEASGNVGFQSCDNVVIIEAPLSDGLAKEGPFDVVIIDGAVEKTPQALLDQLAEGGRLAVVEKPSSGVGSVVLYVKSGDVIGRRALEDAATPYLSGFEPKPAFSF